MKLLIIGNSASGKSTLASDFCSRLGAGHLDLDNLAWAPNVKPPTRRDINDSAQAMYAFTGSTERWVVEGCYADLLSFLSVEASHLIFLDLPIEDCIANAKKRPWESHKYASKREQDKNLPMLTRWIAQYLERDDGFSHRAHEAFFDDFSGRKTRVRQNVVAGESIF